MSDVDPNTPCELCSVPMGEHVEDRDGYLVCASGRAAQAEGEARPPAGAFPTAVRLLVLARSGGYCEKRGCTAPAGNIHHRRSRGMGGDRRPETSTAANAVALCGSGTTGCHGWVESHPNEARELGLRLHRNQDPAAEPVTLRHGQVTLHVDGSFERVTP